MVNHFCSYSDVAYNVSTGDKIYPPKGWYFEQIMSVQGNEAPYNGPQQIEIYGQFERAPLPRTAGEQTFFVNSLGMDFHFTHEQIEVLPMLARTQMLGFQDAFMTVRVRPSTTFISKRFDDLDREDRRQIITEFWSVEIGTEKPSSWERYFPALNFADSIKQLAEQNEELKANGHELLVRYYRVE